MNWWNHWPRNRAVCHQHPVNHHSQHMEQRRVCFTFHSSIRISNFGLNRNFHFFFLLGGSSAPPQPTPAPSGGMPYPNQVQGMPIPYQATPQVPYPTYVAPMPQSFNPYATLPYPASKFNRRFAMTEPNAKAKVKSNQHYFHALTFMFAHFILIQTHSTIKTSRKDHSHRIMARIQVHLLNNNNHLRVVILINNKAIHMHPNGHHNNEILLRKKLTLSIDC